MKADDPINQRVLQFMNKIFEAQNIGPTDLSVQLGGKPITPQYISNVKTGYRTAGKRFIFKLIQKYPEAQAFIFGSPVLESPKTASNARIIPESKELMHIPLVHERAHAGYSEMWSDREWIGELPTVVMDRRTDGIYMAFEVVGDSMDFDGREAIQEGDIIIARELYSHHWRNRLHIPEIFVIVRRNDGILVKQVIGHDIEKGIITCHSFNSYYPDQDINLDDVVKLYYYKELRRRR